MENMRFSAYYQAQGIVPDEEWETLLNSLRTPLPTSFRIAGSRQYAVYLLVILSHTDGIVGRQVRSRSQGNHRGMLRSDIEQCRV
jgi:hypothetical protein